MNPEFSIFGTQFTASVVIVQLWRLIEYWIPNAANIPSTLKRGLLWFVATCAAIGIHYNFTAGSGTLVVTGLTLANVGHGLFHLFQSVGLQEWAHAASRRIAQKP